MYAMGDGGIHCDSIVGDGIVACLLLYAMVYHDHCDSLPHCVNA
jgi:hypothetical protein